MHKVRWGIVGAGRIANTFASDMAASEAGVLQAVAARDGQAASRFADRYGIPRSHQGYEALYADTEVDAVYVATPHTLHFQNSSDALRAGKAVLCEKPITVNAAECRNLIETAGTQSGYLMEAMWTWFLPAIRRAKEWVDAGRIGRIVRIQADFGYPMPYDPESRIYNTELAGGCLLDLGVYPVAFTALFSGTDPLELSVVSRHAPNGVEDDVVATLKFEDCTATLGTSLRTKLSNWGYVFGEEGWIAIPDFWRARECQLWVVDEQVDRFCDDRETNGFNYQIDAVNNDLMAGRLQSDIVPLAASLRFQQHMDLIRSRFQQPLQAFR